MTEYFCGCTTGLEDCLLFTRDVMPLILAGSLTCTPLWSSQPQLPTF